MVLVYKSPIDGDLPAMMEGCPAGNTCRREKQEDFGANPDVIMEMLLYAEHGEVDYN